MRKQQRRRRARPSPFRGIHEVDWLLARAHESGGEPERAVAAGRLAIALLQQAAPQRRRRTRARIQRRRRLCASRLHHLADAYRLLADALSRLSRFAEAERAVWRARALYRDPRVAPDVRDENVKLDLTLSFILVRRNRGDEALDLIRQTEDVLLLTGRDDLSLAKARVYESAILIFLSRYGEALAVLDSLMSRSWKRLDNETLAAAVYNVAVCAANLGDARAEDCYLDALFRLEQLGFTAEALRARTLHAKQRWLNGDLEGAAAEYHAIRAEYLDRGLEERAAVVAAKMIELFARSGRSDEVLLLAHSILPKLEEAGCDQDAATVRQVLGLSADVSA